MHHVQADDESWRAAGEQLIADKEHAATKANAKTAKKLRQRASKQQMHATLQATDHSSAQHNMEPTAMVANALIPDDLQMLSFQEAVGLQHAASSSSHSNPAH